MQYLSLWVCLIYPQILLTSDLQSLPSMEENKDGKQNHQQEQTEEGKPDKQVGADQAEKKTFMCLKRTSCPRIQRKKGMKIR